MTVPTTAECEALAERLDRATDPNWYLQQRAAAALRAKCAQVEALQARVAAAPRLRMTMTPTTHDQPAQLVISNLDPLDLTAGETVVFRLVKE